LPHFDLDRGEVHPATGRARQARGDGNQVAPVSAAQFQDPARFHRWAGDPENPRIRREVGRMRMAPRIAAIRKFVIGGHRAKEARLWAGYKEARLQSCSIRKKHDSPRTTEVVAPSQGGTTSVVLPNECGRLKSSLLLGLILA